MIRFTKSNISESEWIPVTPKKPEPKKTFVPAVNKLMPQPFAILPPVTAAVQPEPLPVPAPVPPVSSAMQPQLLTAQPQIFPATPSAEVRSL